MPVSSEAVSQGIVLIGILAGFAFVIAAEILLRDSIPEELESTAFKFVLSAMLLLITALTGLMYFLVSKSAESQANLGRLFVVELTVSFIVFAYALVDLFRKRIKNIEFRWWILFTGVVLTAFVVVLSLAIALKPAN